MKLTILAFALVLLVSGCGPSGGTSTATESHDVLTAAEIATTDATNAYDAISLKRPWFLQSRGPRSLTQAAPGQTNEYPVVYLDRTYYGEIESLRQIPTIQIREIRYLDSNDATMYFGAGHTGGIILVLSRTR